MDGARTMRYMTDDLRIREIKELSPPAHLIREFPCEDVASVTVHESRQAIHRILHGMDDRLVVVIGPCSIHDPSAALDYARKLKAERDRHAADLEIVMRVYFEKPRTTVGWKGLDQRPRHGRQLPHQPRPARRARAAHGDQRSRPARRLRVSRHDHAAVHRRLRRVGRDRRAHDRKPGASRTGLGPVVPGRLQERHRRQHQDRVRRDQGGAAAASLPVGHQGRAFGHRLDQGQRGLPHHPARRQAAELRCRQCRGGVLPNSARPGLRSA